MSETKTTVNQTKHRSNERGMASIGHGSPV